ncbi:hypothetical protein SADUNF_Sadunf01G0166400 [Salix dunnii]|uniref:AtPDCT1/2 transmembrane domain-containing protein n=1 Tax=Salix dunnii TaxID=1413687 RepID=A0A835NCA7_9ROSI|nr:hypothetical protein SADUNF_Sadunf01G0166400 [Salix dunnii]
MKTTTTTTTSATITATIPTTFKRKQINLDSGVNMEEKEKKISGIVTDGVSNRLYAAEPFFLKWTVHDVVNLAKHHWLPCFFGFGLLFFMTVEYTLFMVPASSPPFDLGFIATRRLHGMLSSWPELNTVLAALNTGVPVKRDEVFVGMQTTYILWTWLVEGRPRATISALFMFTCRGILGYSTQLPLPEEFLGSGADFPVGNVSFFLFFSGHVAGSVIASLDMRRMQRWELAWTFDALNVLQVIRLLGTRGHYTIDLVVGVGAGILFDSLAGKYQEYKRRKSISAKEALFS